MKPIIRVENVGKQYRIGEQETVYATLRETLTRAAKVPFERVRKIWQSGVGGVLRSNGRASRNRRHDKRFWALKNVGFEVQPGEVLGIIGRNGAGKSTLLKILSRITEPTTGQADLYGRVGSLLEVGTGFHYELTGRENIFLNGAILGMGRREIERKFDEIVDFAGVAEFVDTPVKRYSSGMYLRLAFAVAAHLDTEILIVDEVLAVGDTQFQERCLGKMETIAEQGRTVLFVSHNMTAVQNLCTRALLIEQGHIARHGTPEMIIAAHLHQDRTSQDGVFDLTERPGCVTDSPLVLRRLVLKKTSDCDGTTTFSPNDAIEFCITVKPTRRISNPRIAVGIEDALGQRITTVASYFQEIRLPDIEKACQVVCRVPSLALGVGKYLVSVGIEDSYSRMLDSVLYAGWFKVVWHNAYGNGEPYRAIYGPVLTESTWSCTDIST